MFLDAFTVIGLDNPPFLVTLMIGCFALLPFSSFCTCATCAFQPESLFFSSNLVERTSR